MPAVEQTRLRTQTRLLIQRYASADDFVKGLIELYEFYSDRTYNPAVSGQHYPTLQAYNVTPLINRQFELEIGKLCQDNPLSSLDVIDRLWKQEKIEPRQLAAELLGKIPLEYSDQVIERLQKWSLPTEDRELINYLHEHGSTRLRRESNSEWMKVIRTWMESKETHNQVFALQCLIPLIQNPEFADLPQLFNLLSKYLSYPQPRILYVLQIVIETLAKRSPNETVYTLKAVLKGPHSSEIPRLFRRLIPSFPPEQAQSLRIALKEI